MKQSDDCNNDASTGSDSVLPPDMLRFLRSKMAAAEEEDVMSQNSEQWAHCAVILDRLLLVISLLGITAMSVVFLLAMQSGAERAASKEGL